MTAAAHAFRPDTVRSDIPRLAPPRPRLLVTGAAGQVGSAMVRAPGAGAFAIAALDRRTLDITEPPAIRAAFAACRPDAVINCAAYTAVDRAEAEASSAFLVNATAPGLLAEACAEAGIPLLHISTDYVFDGEKPGGYAEADPVGPLNVYGASKAAGEAAVRDTLPWHVILRTSWVFSEAGRNFVTTMLRLACERDVLRVVDDQRGGPTAAADVAAALIVIARALLIDRRTVHGTVHFAGGPPVTWYGFARAIFDAAAPFGWPRPRLEPIPSAAYPVPAQRPASSVLDCRRYAGTFGALPDWRPALTRMIAAMPAPRAAHPVLT